MKSIVNSVILTLFVFFSMACKDQSENLSGVESDQIPDDAAVNFDLPDENNDYNILFIGNSLTASNNLPALVIEEGINRNLSVGMTAITLPNHAIEDHWNKGDMIDLIKTKVFDYVVIQQGPSSQAYGRQSLIEYGELIANLCRDNNAELVYFMVWPSLQYYFTFDDVIKNHRDASIINNALLAPVGENWKDYFDQTGVYDYYSSDGFHPSLKGSKVAAEIISDTIFE